MSSVSTVPVAELKAKRKRLSEEIIVGKDILDLVTGAMYVDPLSIYREYIQNAVDALDEATHQELFRKAPPRIDLELRPESRSVVIRDNGVGIGRRNFSRVLTAVGGSHKLGTALRGFRGVGRLSGLGYCQELIFRSRAKGEPNVSELTWDGRALKQILRDPEWKGGLAEAIKAITYLTSTSSPDYPEHFFEVELRNVVRYKADVLLNVNEVTNYLSQVAPVPFSPEFAFRNDIQEILDEHDAGPAYDIFVNGHDEPLYRPHRTSFWIKSDESDKFREVERIVVPGLNGGVDAIGWCIHHGYHGAIPKDQGIHGLRIRAGNIQVGLPDIVSEIFPEERFNSWSVGEVHVLNPEIVPNGRRDNFEQNVHFLNLVSHLAPVSRRIAKLCRLSSVERNRVRSFELEYRKAEELIAVLKQNAASRTTLNSAKKELGTSLKIMNGVLEAGALQQSVNKKLRGQFSRLEREINKLREHGNRSDPLDVLPSTKRKAYKEVIDLIYECSQNRVVAQTLVDKIIARVKVR